MKIKFNRTKIVKKSFSHFTQNHSVIWTHVKYISTTNSSRSIERSSRIDQYQMYFNRASNTEFLGEILGDDVAGSAAKSQVFAKLPRILNFAECARNDGSRAKQRASRYENVALKRGVFNSRITSREVDIRRETRDVTQPTRLRPSWFWMFASKVSWNNKSPTNLTITFFSLSFFHFLG